MKAAMVFSIENESAVLLLNNGAFVTSQAKAGWEKGSMVPYKKPTVFIKYLYTAACFLVLLIAGGFIMNTNFAAKTVISMDINPSMEIILNRFEKVVEVKAMNEEARAVIEEVSIRNKSYEEAVSILLSSKAMDQYLEGEQTITFSINSDKKADAMIQNLQQLAESLNKEKLMTIEGYVVNDEDVKQAHHLGITAGKYHYIKQLKEINVQIKEQEYCGHSISQLKEEVKQCQNRLNNEEGVNQHKRQSEKSGHGHTHF